jgi:hypothetical protein
MIFDEFEELEETEKAENPELQQNLELLHGFYENELNDNELLSRQERIENHTDNILHSHDKKVGQKTKKRKLHTYVSTDSHEWGHGTGDTDFDEVPK